MSLNELIRRIPKAELHIHIEGSLEPELMFEIARRNGITLRYRSVDALRRAYQFTDLQSFFDIYYEGAAVLRRERDFTEMTLAYLRRAAADNVRHAESFFDPQTHTGRGSAFATVIDGISAALRAGPISSRLILCFLRHLSAECAMQTLEAAFFFQAEDGMRGVAVTGVQTCALPISRWPAACCPSWATAPATWRTPICWAVPPPGCMCASAHRRHTTRIRRCWLPPLGSLPAPA